MIIYKRVFCIIFCLLLFLIISSLIITSHLDHQAFTTSSIIWRELTNNDIHNEPCIYPSDITNCSLFLIDQLSGLNNIDKWLLKNWVPVHSIKYLSRFPFPCDYPLTFEYSIPFNLPSNIGEKSCDISVILQNSAMLRCSSYLRYILLYTSFENNFGVVASISSLPITEANWTNRLLSFKIPPGTSNVRFSINYCYKDSNNYQNLLVSNNKLNKILTEMHSFQVFSHNIISKDYLSRCQTTIKPYIVSHTNRLIFTVIWESNCHSVLHTILAGPSSNELESFPTHTFQVDSTHFIHYGEIHIKDKMADFWGFRVQSGLKNSIFQLFPLSSQSKVKIGLVGDSQSGTSTFLHLLYHLQSHNLHHFFHLGDMVDESLSLYQWHHYFLQPIQVIQPLPISVSLGNHDGDILSFFYFPSRGWFTVHYGTLRVIFLNSQLEWPSQTAWLEYELKHPAINVKFTMVCFHIAPYIEYWDRHTWEDLGEKYWGDFIRKQWVPLFEQYHVDIVVSGHSHIYQHGVYHNIHYTIIGGAGGKLENENGKVEDWKFYKIVNIQPHYIILEINNDILQWNAYSIKDEIIDHFNIVH